LIDARPDVVAGASGGGGGSGTTVQAFVSPQTISLGAGQNLFGTCIGAASPLSVPDPSTLAGQTVKLVKIDAGSSVSVFGGVNGTYFLTNQNQYVEMESDGTNWYIIARN